jgi:hypothetical protein
MCGATFYADSKGFDTHPAAPESAAELLRLVDEDRAESAPAQMEEDR